MRFPFEGYLMFTIVIWIILSIVFSMLVFPLFNGQSSPLLRLLYNIWPGLLISLVVSYSQLLAAMFIFLQQRGKIMSIDNRNVFHVMSYLLFFFNIFLGLISCLLRIIKGVIVGVVFLERVQKSILPRSFEKMDPGNAFFLNTNVNFDIFCEYFGSNYHFEMRFLEGCRLETILPKVN